MTRQDGRARKWLSLAIGVITLVLVAVAVGCGGDDSSSSSSSSGNDTGGGDSASSSAEPLKIAFIYFGPRSDAGWTQAHDIGRQEIEENLGDKVETVFKENVPESPQSVQVMEGLIQDGAKVIFATSYGYNKYTEQLAKKYPDVKFFQMESNQVAENLSQYHAGLEDAYYLAGMAAASISKSGKLGMSAEFPIPNVINFVNGFYLGIKEINPDATLRVVWTNSWYDPPKETQAAKGLVASNVDFIAQNQNSPSTGEVAEQAGIPFVGSFWKQAEYAPTQYLTSAIFTWGPWYTKQVEAILDGSWESGNHYLTYQDDALGLDEWGPPFDQVPEDLKAKIEEREAQLKSGEFNIYTGPLTDTNGKVRLKDGEEMPLEGRYSVSWFPEGILTNVKSK